MSHGGDPGIGRIVLVGFMAAGKTTVGALLADRLGWELVDLDDRIRQRSGRSPGEIIRDDGEPAFRALEAEATAELAGRTGLILAPGGGWMTLPVDARALGPGTVTVWLRLPAEVAVARAEEEGADRPMLGSPDGRLERARALLARREPTYAAADVVVDVSDGSPHEIADEILQRVGLDQEENER